MMVARIITELGTIGLEALESVADLQTRKDRKYLVPESQLAEIVGRVDLEVLDIDGMRTFRYESVYFDTPDLVAAREVLGR